MKKVLICDDALVMRMVIKKEIEKLGFEVVAEASDGEEAVELYKEYKPDITTMDITMPKKSGIVALQEIMAFDNNAKVVMVSAMGQEEWVKQSIIAGAKNFIVKPFTPDKLHEVLNKLYNYYNLYKPSQYCYLHCLQLVSS